MKNLFGHALSKLTVLAVVGAVLMLSACASTKGEGFAIYLTKGDISPGRMQVLSHVAIVEQPVIATDDIVTYNIQTHEITLTASAYERVSQLEVPVEGKSFVVCVDRNPVYWGAFWTPLSSMSFDGVTIMKPLDSQSAKVIKLELGYPEPSFYGGEDPRNNAEVMQSLEQAGKLTSATTADELPHSMKGYELYSWLEVGEWHFTLITGTNRNKTLEEIISGEVVSEDGWVRIHAVGVDAIETVIGGLPENEFVFWLAGLRSEQTPQDGVNIMLPPGPTIDTIQEYAERCGLDFQIAQPS